MGLQIHKKHRSGVVVRRRRYGDIMPVFAKRALWSAVILAAFLMVSGVIYTWYMSQQPRTLTPEATESPSAPTIVKPKVDPNTPVGVSVQSITSPVPPGSNAGITIRTKPEATCTISIIYDKTAAKDSGLAAKKADEFGVNSWTWTVDPAAPVGKWPVVVSCERDKKVGVVKSTIEVRLPGRSD